MKILAPFGTRPEIVKLAPVVGSLKRAGFEVRAVATGQHFDPSMTSDFYRELGLTPDHSYRLQGGEDERVGQILAIAYQELSRSRPDLVLTLGDTHTVPLFGLAARRHGVPMAHLEAGLRSFNNTSLEEANRKVAAALSSVHFAPTPMAAQFLESEGVSPQAIRVVGNPVIDVLKALGVRRRPPGERAGVLITAHRATNVDDPGRLKALVELVVGVASALGRATFPVHPRTDARLAAFGLRDRLAGSNVQMLGPVGYRRMLKLAAGARVILTDSGGLQEEAAYLGVPAVVLRNSTPRWEGIASGIATLAGLDPARALEAAVDFSRPVEQQRVFSTRCPYGQGDTGPKVAAALADPAVLAQLRLEEPSPGRLPTLIAG